MLTVCTVETMEELIELCQQRKITYIKIQKFDGKFNMEYNTINDLSFKDHTEEYDNKLKNCMKEISDLITQLRTLRNVIDNDKVKDVSFSLKFDITLNRSSMLSFFSIIPPGAAQFHIKKKEPVKIDWDEIFADRLNEVIPELFMKKSAKKYSNATYKDLIEVLKQ